MKKVKVFLSGEATITVLGSVVCEVPEDTSSEDVERALEAGGSELAHLCDNFVVADEGDFTVEGEAAVDEWRIANETDGTPAMRMGQDGTLREAQNPLGE